MVHGLLNWSRPKGGCGRCCIKVGAGYFQRPTRESVKARANVRNIVGQQDAALLGPTCCERFHTMLCVVATCWMKFETGQTSEPTSANISIVSRSSKRSPTMLRSFAQHIQQSCTSARALHATYTNKYSKKSTWGQRWKT